MAYRYFATPARKFIIGDAPGHEQYTRNMVTAASSAHAAVVLVDATKLKWNVDGLVDLLPQTRRHSLLVNLLRVPSIIFAVNKLDALGDDAAKAFAKITEALNAFAAQAGITVTATIPMSALKGHNVVTANRRLVRLQRPQPAEPAGNLAGDGRRNRCALRLPGAVGRKVPRLRRHHPRPPRVLGPCGHR